LIEAMPFVFWVIGFVLVMDSIRRWLENNPSRVSSKV
jgi:hypothetical protein